MKMNSIITQNTDECYVCHAKMFLEKHHVVFGTANRKLSEKYGLVVPLCPYCPRGKFGVHHNRRLDLKLRAAAQTAFNKEYPKLDFVQIFGKNYL